jgi:S-adenosylmethionine uptake transporter
MNRDHALLPVFAAAFAVACLSLMDAFMKEAALLIGAYTATTLRAVIGTGLVAPLWRLRGGRMPERAVLKLHLERGVVSAFMALTFFYSLTLLPLAEAIALSFIAPLLALYLARVLLGETISPRARPGSRKRTSDFAGCTFTSTSVGGHSTNSAAAGWRSRLRKSE